MSAGGDMIRALVAKHGQAMLDDMDAYARVLRSLAEVNPLYGAAIVLVSEELLDAANQEGAHDGS